MIIYKNSLKSFNTFGLDVTALKIIKITNINELYYIWEKYCQKSIPYIILGNGSNVLFLNHFRGIVIINRLKGIYINETQNHWNLHVNSGENWHQLVKYTIKKGIFGLENLALIPGCVGSASIQNIGAYGVSLQNFCKYVDIMNLLNKKITRLSCIECNFQYRNSIFKNFYMHNYIIIALGITISKKWKPNISYKDLNHLNLYTITPHEIFSYICTIRKKKIPNPKIYGNAGSFFKNPLVSNKLGIQLLKTFPNMPYILKNNIFKISAAWLIDQCNLKRYIKGGAMIYSKHSLIIINKCKAKSKDILYIAIKIYNCVGNKFGIWLEPEVRLIGSLGEVHPSSIFFHNH
ncbi:UDP-N-acetylmuramate dehydrogenase [Enterobacteriaceae endosymbiont of Plateumaris consimilis]|uniref:UDP-N-acetylmuramate dehydrogenase n=1 Tax=Enterobacteriaceae endosymbiont of Plateumaris consimilis TaxID=2675794 RepID=UPI001448D119|nr:UDP-N-acetylmuramate dehydrogenase [Enterobacteriaceae endosymbiont of Plateumaris consimilis]QJC28431.1 UDP-N-acetylmuramate dehydrogenase [Enterobacteriaceae endosymbiont of Plateumaris consimilis]